MAPRQRLFLPFGSGLDRASGVMVAEPTSFEDLRNVFLYRGKAQVRKGYERTSQLVDNVAGILDQVIELAPIRSEGAGMGVGYDQATRELHLNLMSIGGENPSHQASALANGQLFTLSLAATFDPPVLDMVDTYNRMFIAHQEPLIAARNATRIWSPAGSPAVQDLTADLDDDDVEAPVKFRGVTRYLSYLVGWGYGTESDPNRPEVVRVSLAGDPNLFDPRHWFKAGQRSEPVVTCRQAGTPPRSASILAFKETETYEIFGYSPETFGIRPADRQFGCAGPRLAVTVGDTVFFWSNQGPRMSQGGSSVDLAVPLDIGAPPPATLVDESPPSQAFALYYALDRVVLFVWGRRVYALSIRDPSKPKWSYYELGENAEPYCGSEFYTTLATGGGGAAPAGWPIIQDGSTVLNPMSIELTWFNSGHPSPPGVPNGNEQVEVYLKDLSAGGSWAKYGEVIVDLSGGGPNYSQTFEITGLTALNRYAVSLRYRGGGQYTAGFTDSDPALWNDPACPTCPDDPPAYRTGLLTTATPPEVVTRAGDNTGLWSRTSASTEDLTIEFVIPPGHDHLSLEVYREDWEDGNTTVQNIDGMGPPDSPGGDRLVTAETLKATLAPGVSEHIDFAPVGELYHKFRGRFKNAESTPDFSAKGAYQECHAGPDPPQWGSLILSCGSSSRTCSWAN
ncbi:MAG: hypothetical protein OEO17_13875, partial [Gemmatimonadota bacterium]|nr:hypothetical protein [Gemmatimonadota bacterium]